MQNFLAEKLLLNTKHGNSCTLEVCTAGKPDNDDFLMSGPVSDCLRKTMTHELDYSGDQYFCLYTNVDSYCGINFDELSWRMGYNPSYLRNVLDHKPSLEEQIGSAVTQIMESEKQNSGKSVATEIRR